MLALQRPVFLAPGDYFVGDANHRVHTLLGSCVSITLWQRERRIGAMSHFLLAKRGRSHTPAEHRPDGRYGTEALQLMLQGLARLGVVPAQCEAKLFGGGDMFPDHLDAAAAHVGRRNGHAAHALLVEHGIRLVSHSLFGTGHRKIVFDIATGDVWALHKRAAPDRTTQAALASETPARYEAPPSGAGLSGARGCST